MKSTTDSCAVIEQLEKIMESTNSRFDQLEVEMHSIRATQDTVMELLQALSRQQQQSQQPPPLAQPPQESQSLPSQSQPQQQPVHSPPPPPPPPQSLHSPPPQEQHSQQPQQQLDEPVNVDWRSAAISDELSRLFSLWHPQSPVENSWISFRRLTRNVIEKAQASVGTPGRSLIPWMEVSEDTRRTTTRNFVDACRAQGYRLDYEDGVNGRLAKVWLAKSWRNRYNYRTKVDPIHGSQPTSKSPVKPIQVFKSLPVTETAPPPFPSVSAAAYYQHRSISAQQKVSQATFQHHDANLCPLQSPAFRKFVTQTGVKQTRRSRRRIDASPHNDQGTTLTLMPAPPTTSASLP
ncbi:hypothetical protein [Absidia glauca]|uniref:Uncharacterized protein n=1 Tax=Absidia glauca TaxID=4829 RepID=A0A168SA28_ABSGL|nr:hypothetical protein [Absidia glauca]